MKILIAYDGRLERAWLGSTSTAVIGRAHCSVEVVRSKASE
jgi:nucleotide-binding universal stress UspA family protein